MSANTVVRKEPMKKRPGNPASVNKAALASARSARQRAEYRRRAGNAKELRQSLLDSWNRVSGPSKLIKLAQDDFPTYLRLILSVLPKATDITLNVQRMSDEELYGKIESILTHEVLEKLGYVPVGGKALPKPPKLPTPPIEPATTDPPDTDEAVVASDADRLAQ